MRFFVGLLLLVAPQEVTFTSEPGRVVVSAGGGPVMTYVHEDKAILRPYLAHVRAPGGPPVTRAHPPVEGKDATDHATMHPGIWLGFGDLGGADFWRNKGRVEHERFAAEPAGAGFAVVNRYLAGDKVLGRQTARYAFAARPHGVLLILDSTFEGEFAFGDQEEMGLGVRMATPLTVKAGGRITDSEGRVDEKGVWGKAAAWCDYSRELDGKRTGVLVVPDPANFRPCWWHVRDYGVMVANPFGRKAMKQGEASRVEVKKGDPFRLRFAVLVYSGAVDPQAAAADAIERMAASK